MRDEQELFEHFHVVVDKGQSPLRIDKFLTSKLEATSRNRIQLAAESEYILVNGIPVKNNYKVKPLDDIRIMLPFEKREFSLIAEEIPLDILFEDQDILVVNKPAGLTVHPGHGNYSGTLLNGLAWHFGQRGTVNTDDSRMGVLVHRIDKDTSGLLVVAKSEAAQFRLSRQFSEYTVERIYLALVWGDPENDRGTITGDIARHPSDRLRFRVCPPEQEGKHAVTHYKVLERFGYVTLLECRLETGRTHQIRVHLEHIDHPLFGDVRYGGDRIRKGTHYTKYKQFVDNCLDILPRQALHAKTLGFIHPGTGNKVQFEAPLPEDFSKVLEKWRRYAISAQFSEDSLI
ncbi:MAG: Ribosomal large subunit pseudouridine synthase D [Bacteroidetes bacterium ADurb.Bin037]|nr:MAG: Ribosomal large subunit pseudouridine synthase D [Bacteroidetes bacterium ADurb.Bin037]HPW77792.1 RluA family pseudouridine synthase [Bacteroidales bacterium]HQB55619.1 RluA family pseudouridine synthase [Bacteroidales bacterium]